MSRPKTNLITGCVFATTLFLGCLCQEPSPLQFSANMDQYTISERLPEGTNVYILRGTSSNSGQITFGIQSDFFDVPEPTSGNVFITRQLDFEGTDPPGDLVVTVWMRQGDVELRQQVTVKILDTDDTAPTFIVNQTSAQISENHQVNDPILQISFTVVDPDTVNTGINVRCRRTPNQEVDPCDYFEFISSLTTATHWMGRIRLRRSLDYETTTNFRIVAVASDNSGNSEQTSTQTFEISVEDVQDTPPRLTSSSNARVFENSQINTIIMTITGEDGDTENPRDVRYELITTGDMFALNSRTGELRSTAVLERGSYPLQVEMCEVYNATHTYRGNACRDVDIQITVEDINDNEPRFIPTDYSVFIFENIENDTPFLNVQVTDDDQGDNAKFELEVLTFSDMFSIMPTTGTGSLTASLLVTNSADIDHDNGTTTYLIKLEARETETALGLSSFAFVTVNIMDVNDNPPVFARDSYTATVSELATGGSPVITITASDRDSDVHFGEPSIRYKLVGNGADKFRVNPRTGAVTVRDCPTYGSGNCLDAENIAQYELEFYAGDSYGEGFVTKVPLTINIGNANDNLPRFLLDEYVGFIDEGERTPNEPNPLQVEAEDDDIDSVIRYRILSGNPDGVWQIGETSGIVTATVPVDYEAIPGDRDHYLMTVECTDGLYKAVTTVKIFVRDLNEHTPRFTNENATYYEEIYEDTPPATVVRAIEALDEDSSDGPNGLVRYRMTTGALDKFQIAPETGVVTVAPAATFDFETQQLYEMRILALDQGQPQRSSTATLFVRILDANNKSPIFTPSTVTAAISEDQPIGTEVFEVTARDPDEGSDLVYYLEPPRSAFNPQGQPVIPATVPGFDDYFSIEQATGIVRVNHTLDYSTIARYLTTVKAVDNAGGADQTATATLIVTILQVNTDPPRFGPPWTPDNPVISIRPREGQAPGSYVTTLVATDDTDTIEYRILSDPDNHFNIDGPTGVVTIRTPLDYEQDQQIRFTAVAVDDGQPPLTSTVTIIVNIQNENDETPRYEEDIYNVELRENANGGTPVVQVSATDRDRNGPGLEDYGTIRYEMEDDRFNINPISGQITVADGAELDRETEPVITLSVTAHDSPNSDQTIRRYSSVNVFITLLDDNDHNPRFSQAIYSAVIFENKPPLSSVIQVAANDEDEEGPNSELTFYEISGDDKGMFEINPETGLITTRNGTIRGTAGEYTMKIGVTDRGDPSPLLGTADVTISVLESNNAAPRWIIPRVNNFSAEVIENAYRGFEVIDTEAVDDDPGDNGDIQYGFYHLTRFVHETDEFEINPVTGVIKAKQEFDREERDSYTLLLVARDKGDPWYESTRYLIVKIVDVNDNNPEFPVYFNCCVIPFTLTISEDTRYDPAFLIGTVIAEDPDENQMITYQIEDGNQGEFFFLHSSSGELFLKKQLQYEMTNFYNFTIKATDGENGEFEPPNPDQEDDKCTCTGERADRSQTRLYIYVIDVNQHAPRWPARHTACLSVEAEIGSLVTILEAIDPDTGTSDNIGYNFTSFENHHSRNDDNRRAPDTSFIIGEKNGTVYSNTLMDRYEDHYFKISVRATDLNDTDKYKDTNLMIFVTDPTDEVTLVFDRPPEDVNEDRDEIVAMISELTNGGIVCISDVRYHVTDTNVVNRERTDLTFHVINNSTLVVMDPDKVVEILKGSNRFLDAFGIINVHATYDTWDGFVIDPVVAAIAVILFLLLLLLLLLCLCCLCLGFCAKRTTRYQPLYIGTINPIWGLKSSEDQELTMRVKEFEGIEASPVISVGAINAGFEGDMTDSRFHSQTRTESKWQYESSQTHGHAANGTVISAGGTRIEAPLEGISVASFGSGHPRHRSAATMTDDEMSDVGSGLHNRSGTSGFGATLTRSGVAVERIYGDSGSLHGSLQGSDIVDLTQHGSVSMFPGGNNHTTHVERTYQAASLPAQRTYMIESNELHDMSAPGDTYSDGGFIAPLDQYQGAIPLGTFSTSSDPRGVKKTYVERRETTEYLN